MTTVAARHAYNAVRDLMLCPFQELLTVRPDVFNIHALYPAAVAAHHPTTLGISFPFPNLASYMRTGLRCGRSPSSLRPEVELIERGLVLEHLACRQVDYQARPEQDIDPIDRLDALLEGSGLRLAV